MFPYHDENKTKHVALITYALIAANVGAWIFVQGAGTAPALPASVCHFGLIAGEFTGAVRPGTAVPIGEGLACVVQSRQLSDVITSMFMHGGWLHLLGNMWFLYLFGNNVEDSMGRARFILFYLLSGIAAAMLQVFFDPTSAIPMVGASGAISGVMGGYLVLYPRVKVYTLIPLGFFITTAALPAWTMLIWWLVLQMLGGLTTVAGAKGGGVAFWAHIGGFIAGAILVKLFARRDMIADHEEGVYRPDLRRAA
ncbi:MAG: rhomboid family intramembrane serine protease [Candidatus Rokubacteria bacterium]|nr:rhomboid family intramembrane serine protease [Candidatus Rokubacteria bacterium]